MRKRILKIIGVTLLVIAVMFNSFHISGIYNKIIDLKLDIIGVQNQLFIEVAGLMEILEDVVNLQIITAIVQERVIKNQTLTKLILNHLLHTVDPKPDFKLLRLATVEVKVGRAGGAGTIIAIDEDYLYVLTAKHVLNANGKGKVSARVTNVNMKSTTIKNIPRKNVATDNLVDVGMLKIPRPEGQEFKYLPLANIENRPSIGTKVYTIGHPMGFHYTINEGIVSNYVKRLWGKEKREYMLLSAPSFAGNSGGAAIDCYNEVVGVVVGIMYTKQGKMFSKSTIYLTHLTIAIDLDNIYRFLHELQGKGDGNEEEKEEDKQEEEVAVSKR